jgi:hypothetical protein
MASGAPDQERLFVDVWTGLPGRSSRLSSILVGSWVFLALRWTPLEMILRDVGASALLGS